MSMLELPAELTQLIIDIVVHHTELQHVVRLRETCRQFNDLVQNSIFRLPRTVLLQRKLSKLTRIKLLQSKMLLGNANELFLCYTINRTADYLTSCANSKLRNQYVQVLTALAAKTMIYWRFLNCVTTEKQRYLQLEEMKDNALVAAIGANETRTVQELLEDGANAASNTPCFGEALATAASSGSLEIVASLLDHWDWDTYKQLAGLRLTNAIEAAAAANHEDVLVKLLDYKDRIDQSTYDDTIIRMIKNNHTATVEQLLLLRQEDPTPAAKTDFWLRLVRTAAEYNRSALLQRILTITDPSRVGEASLVTALKDACLENHAEAIKTILPHLFISDSTHHADSLFWAARCGNVEVLAELLTFLQKDQRALLLALAGAVSGKMKEVVSHLLDVAGISTTFKDAPTRFTDIIRLILPDAFSQGAAQPIEPIFVSTQVEKLRAASKAGKLADVINISATMRAHHPMDSIIGISNTFNDAAKNNHLDVLLFLCETWVPHFVTSCVKSPAVAQIFIDFGWDINQTDLGSKYPRLGSFVHDEHFTRWLLGKGASPELRGEFDVTPTSVAVWRAPMSTIRLLLAQCSGIQQGQLLHFAVQRRGQDNLKIIELLISLDCPINSIWFQDDERSWLEWGIGEAGTPLFTAAEQGRDEVVAYLLTKGADAAIVSNRGRTAMDVAESEHWFRTAQILSH
ncbi:uncharacterized protein EKO05_0005031 [Ascochyta rabiei]|uniref:uncharacterized protein n=1 Tax=Didymella rabiei TaxID=5454 RepID=UPI0021FBCA4C|nr:uncharacterized protein EKO05_0005031 [Ascochyta rabiei]UPX14553.1 hypothetical protein EKO05_0005031 [Ascochyta rabiei]